jgi:hypothetical protein
MVSPGLVLDAEGLASRTEDRVNGGRARPNFRECRRSDGHSCGAQTVDIGSRPSPAAIDVTGVRYP